MYKNGAAFAVVVAGSRMPGNHGICQVVEDFRCAKDGQVTAELMTVETPKRVLVLRTAGEFPHRLLDKINVGEVLMLNCRTNRRVSRVTGACPFGIIGITQL